MRQFFPRGPVPSRGDCRGGARRSGCVCRGREDWGIVFGLEKIGAHPSLGGTQTKYRTTTDAPSTRKRPVTGRRARVGIDAGCTGGFGRIGLLRFFLVFFSGGSGGLGIATTTCWPGLLFLCASAGWEGWGRDGRSVRRRGRLVSLAHAVVFVFEGGVEFSIFGGSWLWCLELFFCPDDRCAEPHWPLERWASTKFLFLLLAGQFVGKPVKTLVDAISSGGTGGLNVPGAVSYGVKTQ